ncbi:MAG: VCBS repeat-containing protein [Chloroflexota bacterium]
MNKNKIFCVFLVLTTTLITACGAVTPIPSTIPVETQAAYPTVVFPNIVPSQTLPAGQYGAIKFSLEATRNGKTYEILLAYEIRDQGAQTPFFPQNGIKTNVSDANVQWIGDIDGDGELEYIVELVYCGAYCSNEVQIIHYDSSIDNYRVLDSFSGYGAEKYVDIDGDGNPEIISQDYDYQFKVGGATATRWLAPIKIYKYEIQKRKFEVVTKKYPDWVAKDAKNFLEEAKSESYVANFLDLAAYLYDMYVLGKQDEGTKVFNSVCSQYISPTMKIPNFTCEKYFLQVKETLSEMKIGSK